MLTAPDAYRIAMRWEFPTSEGREGRYYGFHLNDGRPVSEEHRRQCLAYLELACIPLANADIDDGVRLRHRTDLPRVGYFLQLLCVGVRNLRQLYQLRHFLIAATLYAGH